MYTRHVDVHMYVVAYVRSMGRGMKRYPRYRKTLAHPSPEIRRACRGCRLLIMRASDTRCLLTVNARMHSTIHFEEYVSLPVTQKRHYIIKTVHLMAFIIWQI